MTAPASPTPPGTGEPVSPAVTLACPADVTVESPAGDRVVVSYSPPRVAVTGAVVEKAVCTPRTGSAFPIGRTIVKCSVVEEETIFGSCSFSIIVVRVPAPRIAVTRFLAFGDSITEGQISLEPASSARRLLPWSFDVADGPYPSMLQTMLGDRYWQQSIAMDNAAVGGESAELGLRRLPGVLDATQPEVLLLLEGVNGLQQSGPIGVAASLRSMVDAAQARGVQVVIATLTPVGPLREYERPGIQAQIVNLNSRIDRLASERGIAPSVDLYRAFNNNLSLLGVDQFHPSAAGYRVMADTFYQAIVARFDEP